MTAIREKGLRFVVVGLTSNIVLYLLYLALTYWGMGHKLAMSLLYLVGTLQTFFFNRIWTFRATNGAAESLLRYFASSAFGYTFNFAMLVLLVDVYGLPHQLVQGTLILVVAAMMFLLQHHWVFNNKAQPK